MVAACEDSFQDLGLKNEITKICEKLGWKHPTKIQKEVLPQAFQGKDIIGLAETGSGKTGAFALPVIQALLENPQRLFALILTPTRELAFQIGTQFEALGTEFGLKTAVVVGGVDSVAQAIALSKRPHIIIATPGRLVDHLEYTKGFELKDLKYLVLDEADRILDMDFEDAVLEILYFKVEKILRVLPPERKTYLFSATMTSKVKKLQRCSLKDPVKVEVSSKYQTVETLQEYYLFIPFKFKMVYLTYMVSDIAPKSAIIFCSTCHTVQKISLMLRKLGILSVFLHGKMDQDNRLQVLHKFRGGESNILVTTDVASRGLDIPQVDIVVNFEIPLVSKSYIHRVGRTARAGHSGKAITFVSQYDIELFQRIETMLGKKLVEYPIVQSDALALMDRVAEAERLSKPDLKNLDSLLKKKSKKIVCEDAEDGADTRINVPFKSKKFKHGLRKKKTKR